MPPTKVAFVVLDDIHHISHIAPIAFELSRNPNYKCIIYIQSHAGEVVDKIAALYPDHRCQIQVLAPSWWRRFKCFYRKRICSSSSIIRHHVKELLAYDALVTVDKDLNKLIKRVKSWKKKPVFFLTQHGAGDREYGVSPLIKDYDFFLITGNKYQRKFANAGFLKSDNYAVVGCIKFDVVPIDSRPKLFSNDKPIALYSSHFQLDLSSWKIWGLEILEYFYQNPHYNLIFAPHCNLFRRKLKNTIPQQYFTAPNILIDLGSEKSVDMTYTQAADIYIGDVSSQVYEFIRRPRPCIFLNAHGIKWQDDPYYSCWNFGEVINDLPSFHNLFKNDPLKNPHQKLQQQYFTDTFFQGPEKASVLAATAIHKKMSKSPLPLAGEG